MTSVTRRNPKAFANIWTHIIQQAIERYCQEPTVSCEDIETMRRRIRSEYNKYNEEFSVCYMANPSNPLNQRKIAACYATAIVTVRPLQIDLQDERCAMLPRRGNRLAYESRPCFANERLAIHVACSILISYLRTAKDDPRCDLSESERVEADEFLNRGVDLLQDVDGGEFVLNLERTLSIMSLEENFNTPLLACLFSYLEAKVLPADMYRKVLRVFVLESESHT